MIKWCPKCKKEVEIKVREYPAFIYPLPVAQKVTEYHCPCGQFLGSKVSTLTKE